MSWRRAHPAILVLLGLVALAAGGDWPQWRGPNLNGSTDETNLPVSFSKTENIAWVARMPGLSGATPIVLGERIYVSSSSTRTSDLMALCLRTSDGQVVWQKKLGTGRAPPRGEIAAPSPASDGKRVFFLFGSGELTAVDLDGTVLWQRNLTNDYGCLAIKFGFGATPLLYKGKLYLPVLRRKLPYPYNPGAGLPRTGPLDSFVLAMDAATGKTVWRQVRTTDAVEESREGYFTPMPAELPDGKTEIIVPGGEFVTGHDAETGKELWRWQITKTRHIWQRVVTSPVVAGGLVYISQPQHRGLFALKAGARGRVPDAGYVWKHVGASPDVCCPLLYRGSLYTVEGDKKILACLDPKTGKVRWQHDIGGAGPYRASPTGADGKLHLISEGGDVLFVAADETQYRELFRFSLKARPSRSSIVAAHGSLYLRLSYHLVCVRKPPG